MERGVVRTDRRVEDYDRRERGRKSTEYVSVVSVTTGP